MAVSNPLYQRLAGANVFGRDARGNSLRPKIAIEAFLALMRARAVGEITTDQELSDRVGLVSGYSDSQGTYVAVGLDATELQQANDLMTTVTSIATPAGTTAALVAARAEGKADRAMLLIKIREVLTTLEFGMAGWLPDDMAGATVGAVGGRLGVARRDTP
jgi:predicted RNase H-related nuclease YkuK (DUF458 family)